MSTEIGELKIANLVPHGRPNNPNNPLLPVGSQVSAKLNASMACPREVKRPEDLDCFAAGDVVQIFIYLCFIKEHKVLRTKSAALSGSRLTLKQYASLINKETGSLLFLLLFFHYR